MTVEYTIRQSSTPTYKGAHKVLLFYLSVTHAAFINIVPIAFRIGLGVDPRLKKKPATVPHGRHSGQIRIDRGLRGA